MKIKNRSHKPAESWARRNRSQKNQNVSISSDSAYRSAYHLVKTRLSESEAEATIWFSLDHKQNVSDGVVSGMGKLFSLDHKLYASDYDSDSAASENKPRACWI